MKNTEETTLQKLLKSAVQAKENSYSPYSKFRVGAALLCADGTIVTGCNIENAAFSPTICAERTAVVKAVSEGKRSFTAIAIAGDGEGYISPCGVCRQVLAEFVDLHNFLVYQMDSRGNYRENTMEELLPFSFGNVDMQTGQ